MTPSDNSFTISPHNLALLHSILLHSYPVPLVLVLPIGVPGGRGGAGGGGGEGAATIGIARIFQQGVGQNAEGRFCFVYQTYIFCTLNVIVG